MKAEHRQILDKIEEYFEKPEADNLRFWQGLFNMNVIVFQDNPKNEITFSVKDDYNISDESLLKRIDG